MKIDIEDDGRIFHCCSDVVAAEKAVKIIENLTKEVEVGQLYMGMWQELPILELLSKSYLVKRVYCTYLRLL